MNQDTGRRAVRRRVATRTTAGQTPKNTSSTGRTRTLLIFVFLVFLAGGIYFSYEIYRVVNAVFINPISFGGDQSTPPVSQPGTNPGGNAGANSSGGPGAGGQSGNNSGQATPQPGGGLNPEAQWIGKDRLNILLLGIDQRASDNPDKTRSDTMIIVSIDPVKKTVAMLSIPRDLLVSVSGYAPNKINTFHFLGGPELAKRAVQENFGISIRYWIRVNFHGFVQIVDALGGLLVDVDRPIHDDEYPLSDKDDNIRRLYIPSGLQQMNGETALEYARSRHGDSDFGRMQRQQKIIYAMRAQGLKQPLDLARIGTLRDILNTGFVQTDLPLNDIPALFNLAKQIDTSAIASKTIDPNMVTDQGGDLVPDWPAIRAMVKELFETDPHVAHEQAKILVKNGSQTTGLAQQLTDKLNALGYSTLDPEKADSSSYTDTVIITYTDKRYTAEALATLLNVPVTSIRTQSVANPKADIVVIVGQKTQLP